MSLVGHDLPDGMKSTPGEQLYADWCDAFGSDRERYWGEMNRADREAWERLASPVEAGPMLKRRLEYEAANPRPETLVRAEGAIVRARVAEGFGRQYQVTDRDRFEIAVDDLLISVRVDPDFHLDGPPCGAIHKASAVCTRPTGHEGYHANQQGYWL
jgi:hypothetical protein